MSTRSCTRWPTSWRTSPRASRRRRPSATPWPRRPSATPCSTRPRTPSGRRSCRCEAAATLLDGRMERELGIEDELLGQVAGPLLPVVDDAEDLIVRFALAQLLVGVAEDAGIGVLGQEGQHPLLEQAPLG